MIGLSYALYGWILWEATILKWPDAAVPEYGELMTRVYSGRGIKPDLGFLQSTLETAWVILFWGGSTGLRNIATHQSAIS